MLRDGIKTKYSVKLGHEIGETVYNLTVNDMSEDDIDYYSCVVDVIGYTAEYWPSDGTNIQIKGFHFVRLYVILRQRTMSYFEVKVSIMCLMFFYGSTFCYTFLAIVRFVA